MVTIQHFFDAMSLKIKGLPKTHFFVVAFFTFFLSSFERTRVHTHTLTEITVE